MCGICDLVAHMSDSDLSIKQKILHAYVATEHLGQGRPILELAEELGVSRFVVSRMINRARETGLIEVRARLEDQIDVALSGRLARRFALDAAIVVTARSEQQVSGALAAMAAQHLQENIREDELVGVAPGRTLVAASRLIDRLPSADIVQLTGVGAPRLDDGVEAVLNLARAAGGATYPVYAPFLIESGLRSSLLRHPTILEAVRRFPRVTTAVLTIGGWPDASLLARQARAHGGLEERIRRVVADVGAVLLTAEGEAVDDLDDMLVGIDAAQLRAVGARIGVGGGAGKHEAVLAALRSGLLTTLITDAATARFVLES